MEIGPLKQSQIETIELMARNEETLASLYNIYAKKFPEHEFFWSDLSKDETSHANWIRLFLEKFKQGEITYNKNRFKKEAIKTFTEYLEKNIGKAKSGEINIIGALSIALDIEKALIEKDFFEIMEKDSESMQQTFASLESATKIHRDKVASLIDSLKNSS
ncbi:MAG: hypothetical protein U9R38_06650 [Candidatus Margulisiibacteriota bacterium]|nr:hypothetical protein [Candidatus Margulisiibacteriota bacterium]